MRVTEIPAQQVAAIEGTRPLPSLVEWGVAAQDYPGHSLVHWCRAIPNVYKSAPGIHLSIIYGTPHSPRHSIMGVMQSLLKMLGYEHVGAVQLQTFITTSQVLKTDYKVPFSTLYKITFPISVGPALYRVMQQTAVKKLTDPSLSCRM